ncbi:hypothetical protein QUF72_09930 [Desulfobacterales bacterium HSG2]|nr:hypothetical protein [Desulfobacterales bacterium HSG2]
MQAEEIRQYWENRNREQFARIKAMGPSPGKEEVWEKIQAKKEQLGLILFKQKGEHHVEQL